MKKAIIELLLKMLIVVLVKIFEECIKKKKSTETRKKRETNSGPSPCHDSVGDNKQQEHSMNDGADDPTRQIPKIYKHYVGKNKPVQSHVLNLKQNTSCDSMISQISAEIEYLLSILGLKHLRYKYNVRDEKWINLVNGIQIFVVNIARIKFEGLTLISLSLVSSVPYEKLNKFLIKKALSECLDYESNEQVINESFKDLEHKGNVVNVNEEDDGDNVHYEEMIVDKTWTAIGHGKNEKFHEIDAIEIERDELNVDEISGDTYHEKDEDFIDGETSGDIKKIRNEGITVDETSGVIEKERNEEFNAVKPAKYPKKRRNEEFNVNETSGELCHERNEEFYVDETLGTVEDINKERNKEITFDKTHGSIEKAIIEESKIDERRYVNQSNITLSHKSVIEKLIFKHFCMTGPRNRQSSDFDILALDTPRNLTDKVKKSWETILHPCSHVIPGNDFLCLSTFVVFDELIHPLMRYEFLRIRSYNQCSTMPIYSATELAQHGFYHTGVNKEVICFHCKKDYNGFLHGLRLDETVHEENCETGRAQNNVPLFQGTRGLTFADLTHFNRKYLGDGHSGKSFVQQQSLEENHVYFIYTSVTSQPPVGTRPSPNFLRIFDERNNFDDDEFLDLRGAAYPQFASQKIRKITFGSWDPMHSQKPDDLVSLGFFYAGYSDCARCFYCGLGLKYWRPNDNAAYQHARFRPQCKYNQFVKGQEFIDQVQRNIAAENQGASAGSDASYTPNLEQLMMSDAARRVLEEGWDQQEVKTAVLKLVQDLGEECLIYDILMEILTIQKPANGQQSGSSSTTTRQDLTDMHDGESIGHDNAVAIGTNYASQVDIDGANANSPSSFTEVDMALNSDIVLRLLEREHNYRTKRLNCMVCGNSKVGCIYLPCGHVVACQTCGDLASTCILCQKVIAAIANIYLS